MSALCIAPRCRIKGQHAPDCDQEQCAGCLPRRAADGLHLCLGHTNGIAADACSLSELHGELALSLDRNGTPGERTSGSPERTRIPNPAAVEVRTEIRHTLVAHCRLISEERGIDLPADTMRDIGAYIARHAYWLAAQPHADEVSEELWALACRARRVAYPDGTRTVRVGDCPHDGCGGEIRAVLRRVDSLLPSRIVCSEDDGHEWAASEWITLGKQLRRAA